MTGTGGEENGVDCRQGGIEKIEIKDKSGRESSDSTKVFRVRRGDFSLTGGK